MSQTVYSNVRGHEFSADQTLVVQQCPTCGILHAIPDSLDRYISKYNKAEYPNNYASVTCPAGHQWHRLGRNAEQRAREEADAAKDKAARLSAQLDQTHARLVSQKSATTRIKNQRDKERRRTAAGVCPCCNRSFKQLRRHIKSQHPDFPHEVSA